MWQFSIDGDTHATIRDTGTETIRRRDIGLRLKNIRSIYPLDFHFCIGDLTDHGWTGPTMFGLAKRDRINELNVFKKLYQDELDSIKLTSYATLGNHDMANDQIFKGLPKYIADKYDANNSFFNPWSSGCFKFVHKGVHMICLGIWPQKLDWLRENLPLNKKTPCIMFHHYNLNPNETGSDFWSDDAKKAYYSVIKNHNVILICVGHVHATRIGMWHNIHTVVGAGSRIPIIRISKEGVLSNIIFDSGLDKDNISTIDSLSSFNEWRETSPDAILYDQLNFNDRIL
jgi:hypothetical protein